MQPDDDSNHSAREGRQNRALCRTVIFAKEDLMTIKEEQPTQSIIDGAKRMMQGLPRAASGIIGLGCFAYIIGWAYARFYYSEFGASWLINEIPTQTLLGYSWLPVITVLFFAYLGFLDLAETERDGAFETSQRFKLTRFVLNYGRWFFIATIVADVAFGVFGYTTVASFFSHITVFVVVGMATSAIEMIIYRFANPNIKFDLSIVSLTYIILVFGLYIAPAQMGRNTAREDMNSTVSSLSFVTLRDDPHQSFRLLISSGDRFYVFPVKYESKYPPIQIVTASQIQSIQKRNNSTK